MPVCIHIYIHICMEIWMHTLMHVWLCTDINTYMHIDACLSAYKPMFMPTIYMYVCMYAPYIHILYIHILIYACIHTYINGNSHLPNTDKQEVSQILILACLQIFIHPSIIHTYINRYIYAYLIFPLEAYIILELDISTVFGFAIFPELPYCSQCRNLYVYWKYGN